MGFFIFYSCLISDIEPHVMLELRSVSKKFGKTYAVDHVQLTIQEGEFFSLLGPSGCGKTTLLRLLGGFEHPTEGEIWQDNQRIDELPPNKRQFNMVFQRYALFPHLDVWENVAFGLKMKKVPPGETKQRVSEALALVKMEDFCNRGIETLSGGQQQRIALARAFVNRPRVLLLDEPLSALDLKLRQQMQVELLTLQRRLKHSFIFVTHDQEEALTLSDRIAVMNHGVVEQIGTPQEIYEYPKTIFVAQFIGSINSFEGEIRETSLETVAVNGVFKKPILIKPPRDGLRPLPQLSRGAPVSVLVRPEKLKLLKSSPPSEQNGLEGSIKEILYQGSITRFFVQPKEADFAPVLVIQPNSAVTVKKGFSVGDRVFMAWSPEDCLIIEKNKKDEKAEKGTSHAIIH